jgi:nicotinamide riboside transporter PnuC
VPHRRRSRRPYRDSALVYAVLGSLVVVITLATGGKVLRAAVLGLLAFLLATGWTWWRLRQREEQKPR